MSITADNYFVTSNGAVCDAIQAAYIVLRIMGYLRVSCASVSTFCLCVCSADPESFVRGGPTLTTFSFDEGKVDGGIQMSL